MADQPIKAKPVKAYPVLVSFKLASGTASGQILKLTQNGFLAETTANMLQPGDRFEVAFELPFLAHPVNEPAVVIKLYNQWGGSQNAGVANASAGATPGGAVAAPAAGGGAAAAPTAAGGVIVVRLVEIHFQSLSHANKERITTFLNIVAKAKGA